MSDKPRYLTTASVPVEWVAPETGVRQAWNSQGDENVIRHAARHLADGAGALAGVVMLGVADIVAEIGLDKACETLGSSWVGGKLAKWVARRKDFLEAEAVIRT